MANTIGFVAFMAFLSIAVHSCNNVMIEREKTEQIKAQCKK